MNQSGYRNRPKDILWCSEHCSAYLACMATIPLLLVRWPVEQLQLAFGLTGAMLLPMLALSLLVMNNREGWVGSSFRNGFFFNIVLVAALLFFFFVGLREILQLVS